MLGEYDRKYVHYNWHWFWNWGTGETGNNATHELDISRWALQVERPDSVQVNAGKYHFKDGRRGGLLGMGAFLTSTADSHSTSPIHRAVYVMENFLGTYDADMRTGRARS